MAHGLAAGDTAPRDRMAAFTSLVDEFHFRRCLEVYQLTRVPWSIHQQSAMHFPSPLDYYPFDSDAPVWFKYTQTDNYFNRESLKFCFTFNIIDTIVAVAVVVSLGLGMKDQYKFKIVEWLFCSQTLVFYDHATTFDVEVGVTTLSGRYTGNLS